MTVCCVLFSEHTVRACPKELKREAEGDKMEKNEDLEIRGKAFEIDIDRKKQKEAKTKRKRGKCRHRDILISDKKKAGTFTVHVESILNIRFIFSFFLFLPFFPYLCILFCLNPFFPQSNMSGSESSEFTIPAETAEEAAVHRCQPDRKGY